MTSFSQFKNHFSCSHKKKANEVNRWPAILLLNAVSAAFSKLTPGENSLSPNGGRDRSFVSPNVGVVSPDVKLSEHRKGILK